MTKFYYTAALSTLVLFHVASSFLIVPSNHPRLSSSNTAFFATQDDGDISMEACSNMKKAGEFMVEAFWLNSPQQLVLPDVTVSDSAKEKLMEEQIADLELKYGERLGKPYLGTTLIQAVDKAGEILGMVALEVSLLDMNVGDTISSNKSEDWIKSSVASLGPKQRRLYKNAKVSKICKELMPSHLEAVAVLSNLVVSPTARRMGIAQKLVDETQRVAKEEWKYDTLWLRVEAENEAARTLYEDKLGFTQKYVLPNAAGLRVGGDTFEKISTETLVLSKSMA